MKRKQGGSATVALPDWLAGSRIITPTGTGELPSRRNLRNKYLKDLKSQVRKRKSIVPFYEVYPFENTARRITLERVTAVLVEPMEGSHIITYELHADGRYILLDAS